MSEFIEELKNRAKKEKHTQAILKRSLAFNPGTYIKAFPFVEHRQNAWKNEWDRKVYYLVAGLWASHWRDDISFNDNLCIAEACRLLYIKKKESKSIEQRFISLIDSNIEELPYRLRQMLSLLKDYDIDFSSLLKDLRNWEHPDRWSQLNWANKFYSEETKKENKEEIINNKENI